MRGKEKCKALKEIRRQIAEENDIPYVVSQCSYQGDCKGTCPKCESELRYLERELAIRQGLGKAVAVVGISVSVCGGLTACGPVEMIKDGLGIGTVETAGDIAMPEKEIEPEGGGESQSADEALAGMIPLPEEEPGTEKNLPFPEEEPGAEKNLPLPEEEPVTGEILPYPGEEPVTGGILPYPGEEPVTGDILPIPDEQEETVMELEGDIALPEKGTGDSDESIPPLGETAP